MAPKVEEALEDAEPCEKQQSHLLCVSKLLDHGRGQEDTSGSNNDGDNLCPQVSKVELE